MNQGYLRLFQLGTEDEYLVFFQVYLNEYLLSQSIESIHLCKKRVNLKKIESILQVGELATVFLFRDYTFE